jgi:hypothetical protein
MGTGSQVIARVREKGMLWAGAHTFFFVWDKTFDFVLYPLAIINLGLLWGTAAMMVASFLICLVLLLLYDRLGSTSFRDALGFESIKEAASAANGTWLSRWANSATGKVARIASKVGLFLYLSLWFDPMTCTIFMRPADRYQMTRAYWLIFGLSVFVGNAVWGLLIYTGVETFGALIGALT